MSDLITCPKCNGNDINMTGDATTEHGPPEHNWWGQQHKVSIPLQCECGHEFALTVSGYKNRVSISGSGPSKCIKCGNNANNVQRDGLCESCFYFPKVEA